MGKINPKLILNKDEIKKDPAKVGEAVTKIMSKPQDSQEVGDTMNAMTPKYYEELIKTARDHEDKFDPPFYIVVLRKKEFWAVNVLRQWYVARQTRPSSKILREDYPNHDFDLWKIDRRDSSITHLYTLPTLQDCKTILSNAELYDPKLVRDIQCSMISSL